MPTIYVSNKYHPQHLLFMDNIAISSRIKRLLYSIMCNPYVNRLFLSIISPVSPYVGKYISYLPVVGRIKINLPDSSKYFFIENDGKDRIASSIFWRGFEGFEKNETSIFINLLTVCNCIIDIGANTGIYSLIAGTFNKQVYAFEPVPEIFTQLKQNIAANNFQNIQPINSAITSFNGKIDLYIPYSPGFPTSSSTSSDFRKSIKKITVTAQSLDKFANDYNINQVDLIKIDTESTEDKVLIGGISLITTHRPIILCEVLSNTTETELNDFFEKMNYEFYQITKKGLLKKKIIKGSNENPNYLFVASERKDVLKLLSSQESIVTE